MLFVEKYQLVPGYKRSALCLGSRAAAGRERLRARLGVNVNLFCGLGGAGHV